MIFSHTSIVSRINDNLITIHQLSCHAFTSCVESEMFGFWPSLSDKRAQNYKIQQKTSSLFSSFFIVLHNAGTLIRKKTNKLKMLNNTQISAVEEWL